MVTMTVFPGRREIGAAMRWARANGFTVKVTKYRQYEPPYTCHQWSRGDTRVTVGSHAGRTDPDMTIVNGTVRWDGYPATGVKALETLGGCGVIPARLMEVAS